MIQIYTACYLTDYETTSEYKTCIKIKLIHNASKKARVLWEPLSGRESSSRSISLIRRMPDRWTKISNTGNTETTVEARKSKIIHLDDRSFDVLNADLDECDCHLKCAI